MQTELIKTSNTMPVGSLTVVKNFRKVIEGRDIIKMNKELYQFLNLHCGFIAHYDINGFKSVYSTPKEFAEVFIRHFDRRHRYFSGIYPCHEEPYEHTGFSKADIKQEFCRIVDRHKDSIGRWAENQQRNERHAAFKILKNEFQKELNGLKIDCEACDNKYEINVLKEGENFNDFGIICCLFCGQQIKLY
jgi:hypothetical protein